MYMFNLQVGRVWMGEGKISAPSHLQALYSASYFIRSTNWSKLVNYKKATYYISHILKIIVVKFMVECNWKSVTHEHIVVKFVTGCNWINHWPSFFFLSGIRGDILTYLHFTSYFLLFYRGKMDMWHKRRCQKYTKEGGAEIILTLPDQ